MTFVNLFGEKFTMTTNNLFLGPVHICHDLAGSKLLCILAVAKVFTQWVFSLNAKCIISAYLFWNIPLDVYEL